MRMVLYYIKTVLYYMKMVLNYIKMVLYYMKIVFYYMKMLLFIWRWCFFTSSEDCAFFSDGAFLCEDCAFYVKMLLYYSSKLKNSTSVKWHAYIVYAFKTSYSSSIYVKLEIWINRQKSMCEKKALKSRKTGNNCQNSNILQSG